MIPTTTQILERMMAELRTELNNTLPTEDKNALNEVRSVIEKVILDDATRKANR